jgi:hypothetical protein
MAKGRINRVSNDLAENPPCDCVLSLEQVVKAVKQYQKFMNYSVETLKTYILSNHGASCTGNKDSLQRIAMTGISE